MINNQTLLKIKDNTGGSKAQAIKIYKGRYATIGDIILVSIKKLRKKINNNNKNKIIKGNIFKALVIRTIYKKKNITDNYINFNENSIILLNNQLQPLGTRILGPVTNKLRKIKKIKIISLSSYIL